jgi:hypothetical protein
MRPTGKKKIPNDMRPTGKMKIPDNRKTDMKDGRT